MVSLTSGRVRGCKDSIGGISKVYLFPFVNYTRSQIVQTDLVLTSFPVTTIYEFETNNNPDFTNSQQENEGGKFYDENITLEFVGFQVTDEFEKFLYQNFRCIVLDRNGKYRLLGAYNGLICESIDKTTGDSKNSFKGFKLSFTGQEQLPALFMDDLTGFNIIVFDNYIFEDGENYIFDGNNYVFN
jgi:hypothetical protein